MRKRIIEKLKSNKGISLTELLVTLIFCLMTFALVCSAMQASSRELKRETTVSESKILCKSTQKSLSSIEKDLFPAVWSALLIAIGVAEFMTEQYGQAPHIAPL